MLKLIVTISLILAAVLSVTPKPIAYNTVQITWATQPQTTWVNIWNTPENYMQYAASVAPGITNTLTLEAVKGVVFQIQEYKLVHGRLEMITFFNLEPVPHSDFPTPTNMPTSTAQPSVTSVPTSTPISNPLKVRLFTPIIMR